MSSYLQASFSLSLKPFSWLIPVQPYASPQGHFLLEGVTFLPPPTIADPCPDFKPSYEFQSTRYSLHKKNSTSKGLFSEHHAFQYAQHMGETQCGSKVYTSRLTV